MELLEFDSIPTGELDRICHDVQQAIDLGFSDHTGFPDPTMNKILQAIMERYCQKGSGR